MNLLAIAMGGFVGAILRYAAGNWIPRWDGYPLGTTVINLLGCLFLGWFLTITLTKWRISSAIRLGIGTGVTGAFTTFSTFTVDSLNLLMSQNYFIAIVYASISVLGGIAFSALGVYLAKGGVK
jgi:fluoride exporter